jgi:uncharacterized damage-inducible protein DinB
MTSIQDPTMNKQDLTQAWDQVRQKYGVYLRILDAIPEDRYHTNPIPGMRTPAEFVSHVSGTVIRDVAQGVAKGEITADEAKEADVAAGFKTKQDALDFARRCWKDADAAVATIGDAQLSAIVNTPWHRSFPGWVGFNLLSDEFTHHRGQLSAFVRACGGVPPFIWGFGDNEPAYQPKA